METDTSFRRRKQVEEKLHESEEKYRTLVELSPDAIVLECAEQVVFVNSAGVKLFGAFSADDLLGKSIFDLVEGDDRPRLRERLRQVRQSDSKMASEEGKWLRLDGTVFDAEVAAGRFTVGGQPAAQIVLRDITERKRIQTRSAAFSDRVKNNLQIISSLLGMQSAYVKDPQALALVEDSRDRVKSMALIHETLYQAPNLANIDFGAFVRNLMGYLFHSFGTNSSVVTLRLKIERVTLGIDLAITCGLLLHELASNSLKHAFPDERSGEILVEMRADEKGGYRLCVGDNGAGFPPGLDYRQTPSLGLQLVNTLTEDLRGTIELDTRAGTVFTICFPGPSVSHASPPEVGPYRRP